MSKILIDSNSTPSIVGGNGREIFVISEMFSHTIQGEGKYSGYPAVFIRLSGCTLNCQFCDSVNIWRQAKYYTFSEIFFLMESNQVIDFLRKGAHLIFTGGSPLLQQESIVLFLEEFNKKYEFSPFTEIENEGVIMPSDRLLGMIDHWNNSLKLSNSCQEREERYQPDVIEVLSTGCLSSDFKFVISKDEDWEEIKRDFINHGLISRDQIVLMPEGASQQELSESRERVVNMAIKQGVRYCDRLHIVIWDKKTGV